MSVAFGQSVFSGSNEIWTIFYCKAVRKDIFTKITFRKNGYADFYGLSDIDSVVTDFDPNIHISARWSLGSTRWPFPGTVWVIFAHVGCLFSTHRTSVGVRQHTQDVRGCPWLSVSTHRTSVTVRVCPCVSVRTHRTSLGVCQHTQDIRVCPSAHTRRPWLSMCVCVCPSAHTGRPWLSISIHISTLVLGLSTLALLVDCLGDFGPRGLSTQYTEDVHGCPPAHTGRPWLSMAVHQHAQDVRGCLCVSVCVRVCPSEHT
ncbi:hypothetical protein YC2023_066016 [Brassica napus]